MRRAFVETLGELAAGDDRIVLLTGDLGYMVMEPFRARFPGRFFNAGVAEQNMIAMATGLAEAGLRPYVYSIATFAALRPFEFIRNGPVLHRLPVRIVGVGAGFGYGPAGASHYAVEDIAALRSLAGLTIVAPADAEQASSALRATADHRGPVYYSLTKNDPAPVPGLAGRFELGRAQIVREGAGVAIVALGSMASAAVEASEQLRVHGVSAMVAVVSNFYPDPDDDLARILQPFSLVIGVEAQAISGGLCALLGRVIAEHCLRARLVSLAVRQPPDGTSGGEQDRCRRHGLDAASIVRAALDHPGSAGR